MADEQSIRYYVLGNMFSCSDCAHELGSSDDCVNCCRARAFTIHMAGLMDRWVRREPVDDDGTDQFETHWAGG